METVMNPHQPARRSALWPAAIAAVALAVIAVAGLAAFLVMRDRDGRQVSAAPTPTAEQITVKGTVRSDDFSFAWPGDPCEAADGLRPGAQVVITDPSGATAAIAELSKGVDVAEKRTAKYTDYWCQFTFRTNSFVPVDGFYGIQVGNLPVRRYPRSKLADALMITITK